MAFAIPIFSEGFDEYCNNCVKALVGSTLSKIERRYIAHCTLGDNVFCCLVSYHHTSDLFKGPDQTCHRSSLISQMSRFYWLLFLWHFSVACLSFILACLVKTSHKRGFELRKWREKIINFHSISAFKYTRQNCFKLGLVSRVITPAAK